MTRILTQLILALALATTAQAFDDEQYTKNIAEVKLLQTEFAQNMDGVQLKTMKTFIEVVEIIKDDHLTPIPSKSEVGQIGRCSSEVYVEIMKTATTAELMAIAQDDPKWLYNFLLTINSQCCEMKGFKFSPKTGAK